MRGGGFPAARGSVAVVCCVDMVFVVDIAFAADGDLDRVEACAPLTNCEDNAAGKAAANEMGVIAGLRAEGSGLLGGVGSIEAIVIVVLILLAVVLGDIRCYTIDNMLSDAKENLR